MWLKGDDDDGHLYYYNKDGGDHNEDNECYNKDGDDDNEDGDDDNEDGDDYNEVGDDDNDFSHLQHLGRDYCNRPVVKLSLSEPGDENIFKKNDRAYV